MSSHRRRKAGYAAVVLLLLLMVRPAAATADSSAPPSDGIDVSVTVEPGKVDDSGLLPDVGGPALWLLAASLGGVAAGALLLARLRRS